MKMIIAVAIVALALVAGTSKGEEAGKIGADKMETAKVLIDEALKVIERNLEINENLTIRSAGDQGEIMQAYRKLKQASDINPRTLNYNTQRFAPCEYLHNSRRHCRRWLLSRKGTQSSLLPSSLWQVGKRKLRESLRECSGIQNVRQL